MSSIRRSVLFLVILLFFASICLTITASAAQTSSDAVKQFVASYFKLRYDILSGLSYNNKIKSLMFPGIANLNEAYTEADVLDILVQYRKSQPNDMKLSKLKYTLLFNNIKVVNDRAWVNLTDKYEYYFICAPTVKNSGATTHLIQLGMTGGKWYIVKDSYNDPDAIGTKLGEYFTKSTKPLTEIKKALLEHLKKQSGKQINKIFTRADFPKLDGSTATYPLSIEMAKALLGMDDSGAKGFIVHNTTHNAYINLINGKADLILVTPPSDDEINTAKKAGVELEIVPVCKEGFVFLVNEKNPVKNLTVAQVRSIYQGKIKNWKEVGGENIKIIPYQRESNSGSQTLFMSIVMKGLPVMQPPKETLVMGMGELIDKVADFSNAKNALGYSVYYYATSMYKNRAVKLLDINGVKPEKATIKNGKYPFTAAYYAVLKKSEAEGGSARKLLKWLLSTEGQGIVSKSGFVPVK